MDLSKKILQLMNEQGFSYESLEKATGISRSTLQRKISASPNKLKLHEIERIAAALGESTQDLLGWNENKGIYYEMIKDVESLMPEESQKVTEYIQFLKSIRRV